MPTIHMKGPGLNNWFAEQLVKDKGPEGAREATCGPMLEAVERVIAQNNAQKEKDMSGFVREPRYVVLKVKDIQSAGLGADEIAAFNAVCDKVSMSRIKNAKGLLECMVVEKDWPEYEPTWKAIELRMQCADEPG